MPTSVDVSVILCTRNRSSLLAEACRSLLRLNYGEIAWEVIIVDNASTDDTFEVAQSLRSVLPRPLLVVREPSLGLSVARNRGVHEARGGILVFLDDDAFPAPTWLSALVEALADERTYAAGGPVEPQFRSALPDWFSDRFLPYLTAWNLGTEPLTLTYNEYPRGANMAFRREAFDRFGLFSSHLGRKANALLSCEEIELCLRIERGGGRIAYVPGGTVDHVVEGSRITPEWLIQRFRWQGISEAVVEWRHAGMPGLSIGLRRSIRRALASVYGGAVGHDIVRRCEIAGAYGYVQGISRALRSVPRYEPSPEAGPARRWRPFR